MLGLAAGRTIRWEAQLRDARALSWAEAARGLWPQTTLGLGLGAAVWLLAAPATHVWAALFCGPLLLAVPFAVVTSQAWLGRLLTGSGICAVPEELQPPAIVVAAGHAPGLAPAALPKLPGRSLSGAAVEAPAAPPVD